MGPHHGVHRMSLETLVPSLKSQRPSSTIDTIESFILHKRSVEVKKSFSSPQNHACGVRGEINAFSDSAKRNLRFKCLNTTIEFKSQFCLTYHEAPPKDGKELKKHLNAFLQRVRTSLRLKYIWVLEFQTKREVPHFHVFFNTPVTPEYHEFMAAAWNRITGETPTHLLFHQHRRNFMNWVFNKGSYLSKYLEKSYQKVVPDHFLNVGRFWGSSRGIVPPGKEVSAENLSENQEVYVDTETGEYVDPKKDNIKYMYRCLRKYQETKIRRIKKSLGKSGKRYKSQITRITSCIFPDARIVFDKVDSYMRSKYEVVPF